jgi:hypothetical protein
MSLWEYKVITSGKGGFASPALLEKFLNDLGRDEWEIVTFQTAPDNFLAFTGLARRTTQRDWTLQDAAAAAAKAEAEKLRAEFEAKFKAANQPAPAAEERSPSFIEEKLAGDDGFRKPVDTSRDDEPEAAEEETDDWDKLTAAEEDELPTFFEAIKPHMRRNQRGPGMSVGVEYLAKKWDQAEEDVKAALVECGFTLPADEDAKAEYLEYDGDLYWLNINRRGELWINTKEKPRQVFRSVKATKLAVEEEAPKPAPHAAPADGAGEKSEAGEARSEGEAATAPADGGAAPEAPAGGDAAPAPESKGGGRHLPEGPDLLRKIRPHMRRNRRGPGGSGSSTFLARALRVKEDELKAAFVALGLTMPATSGDKAVYAEFGNELWWLNLDSRGGLWINGREKRNGETLAAANAAATSGDAAPAGDAGAPPAAPADAGASPAPTDAGSAPATETAVAAGTVAAPPAEAVSVPAPEATPVVAAAPAPVESPAAPVAEVFPAAAEPAPAVAPVVTGGANHPALAGVRLLLKETRSGGIAGKIDRLAQDLGKSAEELVTTLVGAGLKVPEKPREKPVFVEHAGEIFWLNRNGRGELWLNAKASKFAAEEAADETDEDAADGEGAEASDAGTEGGEGDAEKKPRRSRGRGRKSE